MEEKDRKLLRMLGALSTVGITLVVSTVIGYFSDITGRPASARHRG